jgi:hypothetical protein
MYLKPARGPRTATHPDGRVMTRADLPPPDTRRWVATRKAAVLRGIEAGLITAEDACATWDLSPEELEGWCRAAARHGTPGLRATANPKNMQL